MGIDVNYSGAIDKIQRLSQSAQGAGKRAVYVGAGMTADAIRAAIPGNSGGLAEGLGIAPMQVNGDSIDTRVGFDGVDSKGIANVTRARWLESGTSKMQKQPFIRPTVNRIKGNVQDAMGQEFVDSLNYGK